MAYMKDVTGRRLDTIEPAIVSEIAGTVPTGLGWDATLGIAPAVREALGNGAAYGSVGKTAEVLFGQFSNAITAPAATYYVSTTGLDTNDGLTVGTPFRSIYKAVTVANTGGVMARINITSGIYERSRSFYFTSISPTVDTAFVAIGGRVNTGTFDLFTSATPDATYGSCYTVAVANCDRVVDSANLNRFGNYNELVQVTTADQCNRTPNSWALVAGTLYIHRADEKTITTSNTRVFRNQPFNFIIQQPLNVYVGGLGTGAGFDFEGAPGSAVARVDMQAAGLSTSPKAAIFENSTFKYGGGAIGTSTIGLAASSWHGIAAAFNCQADANATDGFNTHNGQGVTKPFFLTVNCSGRDNGRGASVSCQGLTYHETTIGIDVAGVYEENRGGNIRNIDSSKLYCLGTLSKNDRGDFANGGGMLPTGIRLDGSAKLWYERGRVDMPRGQFAYTTGSGTAAIYRKNCPPVAQPDYGPGTFGTW